ncbi:chromosome segregation protein SMC [Micromonospora echinospora]|uniref:Nuclease SbcCD subunit C n=1 Tax=Micromonospora echinospora TaxID=1877 RepID=A0A1C4UGF9_MICEC|nr:SMC family ATPase [Micromonospora echinospora]OZV79212.1 chromosome segregation protein SMC [Micromonospora echinospora]SCE70776.1 exonuclease SbcC [Micromonospora echinospora]
MRPMRLDMAGFTVFREETTVDFTDADFFALVGPTGSGKSTVLDAICFALYGTVPRWGGARGLANALAPSATEARVRLVFESAGDRYVATRVVRRDGRGTVKTANAGLQLMPPGFDVTKLDTGLSPEDLGEVLAGTPAEMETAVLEAVGLPYEQFTSCVVLPQGQFADFLHAKPATRQQILVNLLGLGVYEEVQKRATERAGKAEARLEQVDRILAGLTDVDDAALAEAESTVTRAHELAGAVAAAVPERERARTATREAHAALAALDADLAVLDAVRAPAGVAEVARAVAGARAGVDQAAKAVALAEEREEKLRGELAGAGDESALRLLLKAHADRDRLTGEVESVAATVAAAEAEHEATMAALAEARAATERAETELEAAFRAHEDAKTADQAVALRAQLTDGACCPVCEQVVPRVPAVPAGSAVARAVAAGKAARAASDAAKRRAQECDTAARERERALVRVRAQHDQLRDRLAEVDAQLAGAATAEALRHDLAEHARLRTALDEAAGAVRAGRDAARRARGAFEAAEEGLRAAWREFDTVRDRLARFGPPAADRDDVAAAWTGLAGWAGGEADRRRADRVDLVASVTAAEAAAEAVEDRIAGIFAVAGLPPDDDPVRAATVAVERAEAAHRRLVERREQAAELREQRAGHERETRVARALAGHLRANNFERWLLAEALDVLVDGASRILRELSGGQYDLVHDKGEFFVVDHHDAGLRRGVRTLSGGETFQASLALALALSEQLAGLSTTAASLESIVLDEGFGTLDAATLDTVAATLESLAARGDRMVGVVTHVPALAERIPVRFEVRKDARSARVERSGL